MAWLFRILITVVLTAATATAGEPVPATNIEDISGHYELGMKGLRKRVPFPIDDTRAEVGSQGIYNGPGFEGPFWATLEKLTRLYGHAIQVEDNGRAIKVVKSDLKPIASVDGPFRIVVKSVTIRSDLEAGKVSYEVALLIHWEPRFPVFRIDTVPTVASASDERGTKLTSTAPKTKSPIGDSYAYFTTIRLDGLTRESKSIKTLEGSFTVTASPKMLAFSFDDFTKLPVEKTQSDVSVTLGKFALKGDRWSADLKLHYPESHPEFESFESWTDSNKLKLISADRTKSYLPETFATQGRGRAVTAEYQFLKSPVKNAAGWTLVYETPAPLTEYTVKFSLKDIPLP